MKKGFTLIELLAVIVILAIIALIATPIVLSIIEETKDSATLRSAEHYLSAVEQSIMKKNLTVGGSFSPNTCEVQEDGNLLCDGTEELEIEVSGEVPIYGLITFEEGKITNHKLRYNENTIVINGELNPKVCKITLDEDNDGVADTGDMITCSTESFHVISNENGVISMLAEYNLDVGRIYEYNDFYGSSYEEIENPTGLQNSNAKGNVNNSSKSYGVLQFCTTGYWWYLDIDIDTGNMNHIFTVDTNYASEGREYPFVYGDYKNTNGVQQNVLYPYVNAYEEYLKKENVKSAEATLISYEQLTKLGCDGEESICSEENDWVTTTSYWSGSASDQNRAWGVFSSGAFGLEFSEVGGDYLGVRPVVNISSSEIK